MGEFASLAVPGLFPEIEPRASGKLRLDAVHSMYWEESGRPDGIPALKDAAQAQRDLEARKTTGSTILIP